MLSLSLSVSCIHTWSDHSHTHTHTHSNEDPVREAEFNIRRFKAMWQRASRLSAHGIDELLKKHDAMGVLELLERIGEI